MKNVRICSLYSGSKGNSLYISVNGVEILIDAGKNARTLCRALLDIGTDIKNISAIFITHEHSDHISALEIISKKYEIPIHITDISAKKFDMMPDSFIHKNLVRHTPIYEVDIEALHITSFSVPHDSMMCVGYRIDFCDDEGSHSVGIATDIGYVTKGICKNLEGCEAVVLESNHDEDMLKNGPYPYDLKKRILSNRGHLSNKASATFGAHLANMGTISFMLAHLSEENNTPDIALDEFISNIADPRVEISVASPTLPTEMLFNKETTEYAFTKDNMCGNS